ncbi:uncharacterized protein LOC134681254 [Mytilus trossulus]|uniref:uncharacterized protein LOC134681254 n=1 Tax=Mytilus trossulus TaxID=6551 RepID=UPI003007D767
MTESSEEENMLSKTERSPRKRKKRKNRKKTVENNLQNTANSKEPITTATLPDNDGKKKSDKRQSGRRSLKHLFKKQSDSNFQKLSNDDLRVSTEDIFYETGKLDLSEKMPHHTQFDPILQPRTRLGCMTLKDAMKEKHSRREQSPSKLRLLSSGSSETSLPDIIVHDSDQPADYHRKKSRSKSAEIPKRTHLPRHVSQSTETTNDSAIPYRGEQLSNTSDKKTKHLPRQQERGRKLDKTHQHRRSHSKEFIDSENQRESFSAFINLRQSSPASRSSSLQRLQSPSSLNISTKDSCHQNKLQSTLNTSEDVTDQKDYNYNKNDNISTMTKSNLPNTKQTALGLNKTVSQMAKRGSINKTDNSTTENTFKNIKEEKRFDRRSYKSPRRFSGRSASRERKKSGKVSENTEKIENLKNEKISVQNKNDKDFNPEDATKDIQTETDIPVNTVMSRSIQTSLNLLDIQSDGKNTGSKTENDLNAPVVPVIIEPIQIKIKNDSDTESIIQSEKCIDEKSSQNSSESEEFKTPKQSPLPDRKNIDETPSSSSKAHGKTEKKKSHEPEKKSKLSFLAIVALKRKIANHRKKKKDKMSGDEAEKKQNVKESVAVTSQDIMPEVSDKPNESDLEREKYLSSFYFENETIFNVGSLSYLPETDILDVDEIKREIPNSDKKLSFDIIEPDVSSDKPMPDSYVHKHGQLAKRRQSEVFREKRKKALHYCKVFVAFLFSHIGLCSLMVAYAILGGTIFKLLEGPFEMQTKVKVMNERVQTKTQILKLASKLIINNKTSNNETAILMDKLYNDTADEIDKLLTKFQTEVYIATKVNGFSNAGEDNLETEEQWSFASSLLFAITVMTTIGYGHVAPKTDMGRIVTIGYAVFGIPLTLLCLTNIGDLMATGFRMLYAKVCCGVCCLLFTPSRRKMQDPEKALESGSIEYQEGKATDKFPEVINVPTSVCILLMTSYILLGTLLFSIWEGWDAITGTYFSFITLSTIGFGDVVPGTALNQWANEEKLVLCAMYLVFGLSLIAMCFNLVQEDVKNKCRWLGAKLGIIDHSK